MRLDLYFTKNLSYFLKDSGFSGSEKKEFAALPRNFWQEEIKLGNIKLENKTLKPSFNIDDSIKFSLNIDWKKIKKNWNDFYQKNLRPTPLKIKYLAKTPDYLVLNKPAGISVHPAFPISRSSRREPTLVESVLNDFPEIITTTEKGEGERPGIVHRLDKLTSGVLLIARNLKTKLYLKREFKTRKVKKTYLALVEGGFPQSKFEISGEIGKLRQNPLKQGFSSSQTKPVALINPKQSLTKGEVLSCGKLEDIANGEHAEAKVVRTWSKYLNSNKDFTLLRLFPHTGRTHQIRVHLANLGFPIVGDKLYGSQIIPTKKLHCLHAYRLKWKIPSGKSQIETAEDVILF